METQLRAPRAGRAVVIGMAVALAACGLAPGAAQAASPAAGPLFERPFVVEHHVRQTSSDGTVFEGEPVTDTYGGSWIVSLRKDGGRTIVDLARREITQCNPASGTYSTLSFDRLAELRRRLRAAEGPAPREATATAADARAATPAPAPALTFTEGEDVGPAAPHVEPPRGSRGHVRLLRVSASPVAAARPGTADAATGRSAVNEVTLWVDDSVRLQPAALAALARFEAEALGGDGDSQDGPARLLAAAREHTGGAFPVRTRRPLRAGGGSAVAGQLEDIVTRLEPLGAVPAELVSVPEGFRRAAHPLEVMVAHAEAEAALRSAGRAGAAGQARP